nr:hypothetical protein [Bacillota bacterium]
MRARLTYILIPILILVAGMAGWWLGQSGGRAGQPPGAGLSGTGGFGAGAAPTGAAPAAVAASTAGTGAATQGAAASASDFVTVRAVTIAEEPLGRTVVVTGTVMPNQEVTLVAKVPGTVRWVAGDLGARVEAGQPVVQLDDKELRLSLEQRRAALAAAEASLARLLAGAAEEELAQARAAVAQAEAGFERVAETLARYEVLYQQGIISADAFEAVRTEHEVARLQLESARQRLILMERGATREDIQVAEAQVQQARVAVELAEQQLADATIRAPFTGLLASRPPVVGSLVGAGSPVASLVDIDRVLIEAGFTEREVNGLAVGQAVRVQVDALGNEGLSGTVVAISPVADRVSRAFPVRFAVDNPGHRLKPGMVARVEAEVERVVAPVVPRSAVFARSGRHVVYVIEERGSELVVRETPVTVGLEAGDRVAVTEGLVPGVRVAVPEPGMLLRDGARVRVIQEER